MLKIEVLIKFYKRKKKI